MVSGVRRKWQEPGSPHASDAHAILGGEREEVIALVLYDPRQHALCWADARLIAAAPQMLDALEQALGALWELRDWRDREQFEDDPGVRAINGAIEAALGEAARRQRMNRANVIRPCTCHPDDRPARCQRRYAATECQEAARDMGSRVAAPDAGSALVTNEINPLPTQPSSGGEA